MKKDPYLSELEKMGGLVGGEAGKEEGGETEGEVEEPTRIDTEAPETAVEGDDVETGGESPIAKGVLDLSPDIPVPVVAVIGRKRVTVGDLISLHEGEIIDFDRGPADPVDLVAGGKVIGKGELVEVDGRLGIRILKILK